MTRIAVLTGGGSRNDLPRQLALVGQVVWYDRADALVADAGNGGLDAVVTGLRDERGRSVASVVVDLAARRPSLPVIVHARLDRAMLDALLAVFALGLRMECAVRPFARVEHVLRYVLSASYRPGVAPLLLHRFVPHVPAALSLFVTLAILEAPARRAIEELARWSRTSTRTIERHLRAERWPVAHVVSHSFSALDAVWLMTEYGWSARRVQQVRGFSHPSGVTRLLSAYAGTKPATLAEDGGFPAALEHVTRVLGAR